MKFATRSAIAFASVCIVALGIAACGGGSDSESSTTDSGSAELSGKVTVWDLSYTLFPEYTKAIKEIDAEFEKANPGVTVERIYQPEEGYLALVRSSLLSGEVPDVLSEFPGYNGVLSFTDFLEVLNDRISPEMEQAITQWSSATPGLVEEGDHYGVPTGMNGAVFYYNKKLFAKAGLPTEFQPESWDEMREAAEKLKDAGIQPFTDGNKGGNLLTFWMFGLGLQTENSQEEISEMAEGEIPYTDPRLEKAFLPLVEMYDADVYPSDNFSTEFTEGLTSFEEGKGAMVLGLWSAIGSYLQFDAKLGEKNVGMFAAPGASGYSVFGNQVRTIPIAAKNKDAAWALMEFEASKESVEKLFEVGKILPMRTDVPLPPDELSQGVELIQAAQNRETQVFPLIAMPASAEAPLVAGIEEVVQGRASVPDVQKAMQEAVEKEAKNG